MVARMTDLYIKTPTQADYNALMRLAEAAGYEWIGGCKPKDYNAWSYLEDRTVINIDENTLYFEPLERIASEERVIETIPKLAKIKAIWKVKPEDLNFFTDKNLNTSDFIKDWALKNGAIILLKNGSYDLGFEKVHKALAVEYKPGKG